MKVTLRPRNGADSLKFTEVDEINYSTDYNYIRIRYLSKTGQNTDYSFDSRDYDLEVTEDGKAQ